MTEPSECENNCGRRTRAGVCAPCRRAAAEGYGLSPAPGPGERAEEGRAERLRRYEERAALGLPLFGEEEG